MALRARETRPAIVSWYNERGELKFFDKNSSRRGQVRLPELLLYNQRNLKPKTKGWFTFLLQRQLDVVRFSNDFRQLTLKIQTNAL